MRHTTDAPLVVFSDDWGGHPSSCQHLVRHLLPRHDVTWVNMIGMRRPGLNAHTVRRGMQKVRQWLRPTLAAREAVRTDGPLVLSPKLWPGFGFRAERWLNRRLLLRQLLDQFPTPPVAITTTPVVADLVDALPVRRWVYYGVDDFALWPGLDHAAVRRLDDALIRSVDVRIAVSETLRERMRGLGRESELLTHGIELDFWQPLARTAAPELADLPRPIALFWGLIDPRMDTRFVEQLNDQMHAGSIVFVGPTDAPDPRLQRLSSVRFLPAVPLDRLPSIAAQASVLIMPYGDLPVTRAMQPLKLKEYLATGKPVVARDLPSTREWADCMDIASSPAEFARRVNERLIHGLPTDQATARRRLDQESWAEKSRQFEKIVFGHSDDEAQSSRRANFSLAASSGQV